MGKVGSEMKWKEGLRRGYVQNTSSTCMTFSENKQIKIIRKIHIMTQLANVCTI